jgi:hypothetical protein
MGYYYNGRESREGKVWGGKGDKECILVLKGANK